jgi:ribosomal protein S18 acetylase RimI-like enzyme
MDTNTTIRDGRKEDLPAVFLLIKELAEFERAPHEVTNSVKQLEIDGFGPFPAFGFIVAENEKGIVGLSLYYYRYSTWKGKRLYLEDIIVTASERGKGIGRSLFLETMKKTVNDKCVGMTWQVLDWNEPAIAFYKAFGSRLDEEWINCHLEITQIEEHFKTNK